MSGIYIPDVSLPGERDFELWISIRKDGSFAYNVKGGWQNGNQKAISVQPHWRLIDADRLAKEVEDIVKEFPPDSIGAERYRLFAEFIKTAPTVIPAEVEA